MQPKPPPSGAIIRQRLEELGISGYAVSARLKVHRTHLNRVLNGERRGVALRRALAELLETETEAAPAPGPPAHEDVVRLVDAATHMFFLKRGDFESEICRGLGRGRAAEEIK